MTSRRVKWLIGLIALAAVFAAIFLLPAKSLLGSELPFSKLYTRALFILLLCLGLCLFRILRGPTPADRIVTIDIIGILIVGLCAIISIPTGRSWYIDIGIAWALQSFIGTLALAKYLEGKHFDD